MSGPLGPVEGQTIAVADSIATGGRQDNTLDGVRRFSYPSPLGGGWVGAASVGNRQV